ncbi:MAG: glycoside hydrolase family 2 TIM barrel-domain containing protein [Lachnospiraceae bacterium]|nr:glycoside hydrolase family 2 TIM barrel-domain containing protein [Lachnospiraceae bacterium]
MRKIMNINTGWCFLKDVAAAPENMPSEGEAVDLPHTWNTVDGQDGGNDYFRGTCCYVKMLHKAELPPAEQYYLEILGANSSAAVFLNGKELARHDGGYSTWRVNLTDSLQQENCLAVLVDNSANDRVYPQTADFTFYGGLYRDVNIIAVPEVHFDLDTFGHPGIHVSATVQDQNAAVEIRTFTTELPEGVSIRYRILDGEGVIVGEQTGNKYFTVQNVHLWDGVEDPYLYTAEAELVKGDTILDKVTARFGCRSFSIDPEKGFILNGREYPLRGVSRHQDRWGIGNALLPDHHREDMDLICELGANTIRLAHYQHDQYFYDLCDERGMVIWAEIPYISRHMPGANENAVLQMKELITQCYNHPSICVWGLSNEITMDGISEDMVQEHHVLNNLVHSMDPSRPTTIACLSTCSMDDEYVHIPDVVAYNHYFGWYGGTSEEYGPWFDAFHEKYPETPIGISEYGCESLNWHNSNPKAGDYSEEYQAMYHESLIRQLFTRKYLWATHVWNMFDFGADARAEGGENGQNHKGLMTFDRTYKKDSFYAYKAWLSKEPFVHLCGKRYIDRVEDTTKITVYSNLPEVELFANGKSIGKQTAEDHFFYFAVPNAGETKLEAVAGQCRDESMIRKVEKMNPDYILREQGAVLNWFDITEIDGYFSLNDTIGDILTTEEGQCWFAELNTLMAAQMGQAQAESEGAGQNQAVAMDEQTISMISNFTVLRFTGMLGMRNISFNKEELLAMNAKLNTIKKRVSE